MTLARASVGEHDSIERADRPATCSLVPSANTATDADPEAASWLLELTAAQNNPWVRSFHR